jgi:hypothetical protein
MFSLNGWIERLVRNCKRRGVSSSSVLLNCDSLKRRSADGDQHGIKYGYSNLMKRRSNHVKAPMIRRERVRNMIAA